MKPKLHAAGTPIENDKDENRDETEEYLPT
jgi:hypothetical protein